MHSDNNLILYARFVLPNVDSKRCSKRVEMEKVSHEISK